MRHATSLLLALALVGCSSLPAPATAQEVVVDANTRVIHVDANATVKRAPDRAVVHLAVETVAPTAQEASQQNAQAMERVIAALLRLDIDRDDIQTRRVELYPRYDDRRRPEPAGPVGEPQIVGYTAMNQVTVTLDDVGMVGSVVDAAVSAGANRVNGIQFELRDPEAAHHEALRLAIQKARREAEVIAAALGERLGPAIRVSTSAYQPMYRMAPPAPMMDARAEMQASTPVEPGELDVHANVSITFTIGT